MHLLTGCTNMEEERGKLKELMCERVEGWQDIHDNDRWSQGKGRINTGNNSSLVKFTILYFDSMERRLSIKKYLIQQDKTCKQSFV